MAESEMHCWTPTPWRCSAEKSALLAAASRIAFAPVTECTRPVWSMMNAIVLPTKAIAGKGRVVGHHLVGQVGGIEDHRRHPPGGVFTRMMSKVRWLPNVRG